MRKLCSVLMAVCLAYIPLQAQAAKPVKESKERLVLMPMRVDESEKNMLASMETALVQGLQLKYEVFSGEQVAQKSREIFRKESRTAKKECDETRCMEDIAIAFQSELIATANVTKLEGGYLLALSIRNVMDNKAVYSNSMTCEKCSVFQVVEKLKELSGASMPERQQVVSPAVVNKSAVAQDGKAGDPETILWNEIKNSQLVEDYQTYLAQYPKGKYGVTAKLRIKKLQDETGSQALSKEQQIWQAAERAGGEAGYQNYLNDYPQGNYAGLAQVRIRKLQSNDQASREEQALWQAALDRYSVQAVQTYLDKYPGGKYVEMANKRIKKIRQEDAAAAKQHPPQGDEPQSAAERLREAEAASLEEARERRGVIVLPSYLKKLIPIILNE